jgi:hypothetical protein
MQGTLDVGELTLACETFLERGAGGNAADGREIKPQGKAARVPRGSGVRPHSSYQHLAHKGKDVNSLQWESGLRPSM